MTSMITNSNAHLKILTNHLYKINIKSLFNAKNNNGERGKLKLKQFQPSITAKSQISKPMRLGKKS